ncbi:S1 RNA-binding domain-containing protein [Actinomadura rudentiformis]|uniref:S1 RNA-binding domain-containing protein n=1 Tax=Actinomadura rudentiformis TaxID=359158 RepID=A0A6H9Z4A2_9ACTN|nr:S1 RNA-binding domain-containing protein [Actinomadura rudentiformis]
MRIHDIDDHEAVPTGTESAQPEQASDAIDNAWNAIEKTRDEDGVVTGTVVEAVKGGLVLDIGVRGFMPSALVELRRVRDLRPYVGRVLEAKVTELDRSREKVVLSRRAYLEQTRGEARQSFLDSLEKGQVRKGVVSSVVNFGAFVDLGGADGLVHVSELSWKHVDHPSEVVEVGQEVTVEVRGVDMERQRVSLSLRATLEDPWQWFARTHQVGQFVPGRVTKLMPFGAFVQVGDGIEGLAHISELSEGRVETPEEVVRVNDEIFVKIVDIDPGRRRVSLSLKQANEADTRDEYFDPTLYGMPAEYDDQGNYKYPEGFDAETGEWLEGFDEQRDTWEQQYAEAWARFEHHRRLIEGSGEAGGS